MTRHVAGASSNPVTAADAGLLQVNCTYRFAACDALTKVQLQECLTANNSKTKPDIDVNPAPQCVSQPKDTETCKKSKREIFAVTGFLHPTDDIYHTRNRNIHISNKKSNLCHVDFYTSAKKFNTNIICCRNSQN